MIPPHQSMPSTRSIDLSWYLPIRSHTFDSHVFAPSSDSFRTPVVPCRSSSFPLSWSKLSCSCQLLENAVPRDAPSSEVFKSEAPRSEVKCSSASLFWKGHADTAEESAYIHPHLEVMEQLSMPHDPPTSNTSARWSAPHLMGVHEDCDVTPVSVGVWLAHFRMPL